MYTISYTNDVTQNKIHIIDSHTAGEPTRVVLDHRLALGGGSMRERLEVFRSEFDKFRSAIANEPRGNDAIVGALLCQPVDPACVAGVIFFNNVGYLGMCGHGTIGLITTLKYLGSIKEGVHRIETPVGLVQAELHASGEVTVDNVTSYRLLANVSVDVKGIGTVTGDVAWGGNWFFLTNDCPIELSPANLEELLAYSRKVRRALASHGVVGPLGEEIDHVELFGAPAFSGSNGRSFVLCPGNSYDRSPCGTGTSAKMACLFADGKLAERQTWRQESVIGSTFDAYITVEEGAVRPHIRGSAFVNAEIHLVFDERDPFQWGMRVSAEPLAETTGR